VDVPYHDACYDILGIANPHLLHPFLGNLHHKCISFFIIGKTDGILRRESLRSAALDALAVSRSWNDFLGILKGQGIDMRFNHVENSDKIRGISFCMDEFSIAGSKLDCDLSFNSLCVTLGNVTTELIIQPHQAITSSGGGGTSNEQGWRDDKNKDSQRNEPFYKPSKRRR